MDLSDSPSIPACPSRASGWITHPTPGVSRVASDLRVQTCHRHYPGGTTGEGESFPGEPMTAAFPVSVAGRLPRQMFRGLLGVHSRYGLPARGVACATLCIRSFGSIVTSTTVPIATGWNDSCRVGLAPTEDRRLGTAHTVTLFSLPFGREGLSEQTPRCSGVHYASSLMAAQSSSKGWGRPE
jgi:hypothetical protein